MNQFFQRVKDYFTANVCRKIFFFALLLTVIFLIVYLTTRLMAFYYFCMITAVVAACNSMADSMVMHKRFLTHIRSMQYEHVQSVIDEQEKGNPVEMTPTFTEQEKKYIRHKRVGFFGSIILKLALVVILFSLLIWF